jgi:hypothetical protein
MQTSHQLLLLSKGKEKNKKTKEKKRRAESKSKENEDSRTEMGERKQSIPIHRREFTIANTLAVNKRGSKRQKEKNNKYS